MNNKFLIIVFLLVTLEINLCKNDQAQSQKSQVIDGTTQGFGAQGKLDEEKTDSFCAPEANTCQQKQKETKKMSTVGSIQTNSDSFSVCNLKKYNKLNESCDEQNGVYCLENLFCNGVSHKCELDNTYSKCDVNSECYAKLCLNKTCTGYRDNGDSCDADVECFSKSCHNGVCVGFAPGVTCDPSDSGGNQCGVALFCDSVTKTCISQLKKDQECHSHLTPYFTETRQICKAGYVCDLNLNRTVGYCKKKSSLVENEQCGRSDTCVMGLACQNEKCTKSFATCDDKEKFCPIGYYCSCNSDQNDGVCVKIANFDCQEESQVYVSCIEKSGCLYDQDLTPGTCSYKQCFEEMRQFECCKQNNFEDSYYLNKGIDCNVCSERNRYYGVGGYCDSSTNAYCYDNLWCDETNNLCRLDNTGKTCLKGNDCFGGICINSKCSIQKSNGDDCVLDNECYSGNCQANVCKGESEGLACLPDQLGGDYCDVGLYCDSIEKICKTSLKENEECVSKIKPYYMDWKTVCAPGFLCEAVDNDYQKGFCKRLYSSPTGDTCETSITCALNEACQNHRCTANFETCDLMENHCPVGYHCKCGFDEKSGVCQQFANTDCQLQASILAIAIDYYQCPYEDNPTIGTCVYEKCYDQLRSYECCLAMNYESTYNPHIGMNCQSCQSQTIYSKQNEYCNPAFDELCYNNLWCDINSKKCTADNTEDRCISGNECYGGVCANNKCSGMKDNGESCVVNEQCFSGNCEKSICRGSKEGSDCDSEQLYGRGCDQGLYCDSITNTCTKQILAGEECISHIAPYFNEVNGVCTAGYLCNSENLNASSGHCVRLYSLSEGEACGSSKACKLGMACQNNECTDYSLSCNEISKFCPEYSQCDCSQDESNKYGVCKTFANLDCRNEQEQYIDCVISNKCSTITKTIPGTCAFKHCKKQLSNLQCCLQTGYESSFYLNRGISCNIVTPTPSNGKSSIAPASYNTIKLGVGVGVPISILLIIIGFFLWPDNNKLKNKENYQKL
ncbi:dd-gdca protein [Anaeramoeba flamelloides]|uniref:Dd-gdca protein n=1 Tax=Anaeramoeba flamelloides TaxID=1746091 RepID=A0ABQ8Y115_9EUKA|nr:dd-gdca protein [Anaeramoeba flamelloides]